MMYDPDGMEDKKWILSGLGLMGKGVVEVVGGAAMAYSGVGIGAAAFLISDGFASFGLGLGMATAGAIAEDNNTLNEQAYDLIKDGPVETFTKGCDMATETEVPFFEIAGNVIESAVGLSTLKAPSKAIDVITDGLTIKQTIKTLELINNAFSSSRSINSERQVINTSANNLVEWNNNIIKKGLWAPSE